MNISLMENHKNTDDLPNYEGPDPVPSMPFDLQPSESNLPCIHVLCDNALLHIFKFMNLEELLICKNVCKRFNNLANIAVIDKLRKYNDGCFKNWFPYDAFKSAGKILRIGGHILTKIEIRYHVFMCLFQFIDSIREYCPNLEELCMSCLPGFSRNDMSFLGEKCTKLKKLVIDGKIDVKHKMLHFIFTKFKKLEILQIHTSIKITRTSFVAVPDVLKRISCLGRVKYCNNCRGSAWRSKFARCMEYEVWKVSGIMPPYMLHDEVNFCPNMKELVIKFGTNDQFEWSLFPKLKKLIIIAGNIYLYHFSSNEFLDDLNIIKSSVANTGHQWIHGDFTSLTELQRISDDWLRICSNTGMNNEILGSIDSCTNLEYLRLYCYIGSRNSLETGMNNEILRIIDSCTNLEYLRLSIAILDPVIHCIEKLPLLKELICCRVTIGADDIQRLVNARHRSTTKLKLEIRFDKSALLQIVRLHEANYEVSIYDPSTMEWPFWKMKL